MVQSGERILFASAGEGQVEAHVQISYQGEAEDFAWVVPVVSEPELAVGIDVTFQELEWRTSPYFQIQWENPGECDFWWGSPEAAADAGGGGESEGEGRGVEVLSRQDVGPYDAAVISSDDAEALVEWLQDNDYRVDDSMVEIIATYVETDHVFVALRLQRGRETGEIQPLVMRFSEGLACIPLRLTAIAAIDDMPVRAWLLGPARAVPLNYRHVRVNWAAIDWLNGGYNYQDVVRRAADEAGGNAFTTDYAGSSDVMDRALWERGRFDTASLGRLTDPAAFMQALIEQGWPATGQTLALLERYMPVPEELLDKGIDPTGFYDCVECYREYLDEDYEWDPEGLAAALEEAIVTPLREAQALFDRHAWLTRLNTYISPEEMDVDPILSFNDELPPVPRERTATARVQCEDGRTWIELTLPDDSVMVIEVPEGGGWPEWDAEGHPAAGAIEQFGESGPGEVIDELPPFDEREPPEIGPEDPDLDVDGPDVPGDMPGGTAADDPDSEGCACRAAAAPAGSGAWAAAALAALAASRRRRFR